MSAMRNIGGAVLVLGILLMAGCGGTPPPETGYTTEDNMMTLLDKVTRVIGGVVTPMDAEAAVPQLETVIDEFDRLADYKDQLNPSDKEQISAQAARALPGLKDNARRMNNLDGVGEIIGGTMNDLVNAVSRLM